MLDAGQGKDGTVSRHRRPNVPRETIMCCRNNGTISLPGGYTGLFDHIPFARHGQGLHLPYEEGAILCEIFRGKKGRRI
jgi:hypothetical protein